jgi:hypothetical protein
MQNDGRRSDARRTIANRYGGEFRALLLSKSELGPPAEHHAGYDVMAPVDRRHTHVRLLRLAQDDELFLVSEVAPVRTLAAQRIAPSRVCQGLFGRFLLSSAANTAAYFRASAGMKMRAPVNLHFAAVEQITPAAQTDKGKIVSVGVMRGAQSAPVLRLDMHRPERLNGDRALRFAQRRWPSTAALTSTRAGGSAVIGASCLRKSARCRDAPDTAPPKPAAIIAPVKQRRSAAMEFFGGLDVSIDQTAVCVVDDKGAVHLQTSVATDAGAIMKALKPFCRGCGVSAMKPVPCHPGCIRSSTALGLPAVCLETRHVHAAMSAQRNKTDATDALGIAHIVRTGWFKAAFIKSEPCYRMRLLLTQRRNLKRKFLDIENTIRHSLKAFGVRLKGTSRGEFDQAVRAAVANDPLTRELMEAMLTARAALWKQYCKLHDLIV